MGRAHAWHESYHTSGRRFSGIDRTLRPVTDFHYASGEAVRIWRYALLGQTLQTRVVRSARSTCSASYLPSIKSDTSRSLQIIYPFSETFRFQIFHLRDRIIKHSGSAWVKVGAQRVATCATSAMHLAISVVSVFLLRFLSGLLRCIVRGRGHDEMYCIDCR